eukprot:scaffold2826_cov55-Phaeocystis_antarctica.AAC.6
MGGRTWARAARRRRRRIARAGRPASGAPGVRVRVRVEPAAHGVAAASLVVEETIEGVHLQG